MLAVAPRAHPRRISTTVGVSMVASLGAMAAVGTALTVPLEGLAAYVVPPDTSLRRALGRCPENPTSRPARNEMIDNMPARVLVVDDDPEFRGLVVRIVAATDGVDVREADSVATAMEAAMAMRPGAALVDVGLPDGDGITLARWLTGRPWGPHVVLTSTDPDAASAEDVRSSGAHAFVPKDELSDAPLRRLLRLGPR